MTHKRQNRVLPNTTPTRISATFSASAERWLHEIAAERGVTVSEVLRRIVDEVRRDYIVRPDSQRPAA